MRFADHFDIASETSEPAKPITADNTSSALKLMPPDWSSQRSTPSKRSVMFITNTTARLVKINRKIRFINSSPQNVKIIPRTPPLQPLRRESWAPIVRFQELICQELVSHW